jgi:hypothetical protein
MAAVGGLLRTMKMSSLVAMRGPPQIVPTVIFWSGLHAPLARRTRGDETRAVPSWRARILIGAVSP